MDARTMLVAAVAAAAAVTSACSPTVSGTASTAASTGRAPAIGTVAAAPLASASHATNWVSITGESDPAHADALAPGTLIRGLDKDGDMASCSVGTDLAGNAITTAGHCGLAGSPRLLGDREVGSVTQSVDRIPVEGPVLDFAVVKLTVPVAQSPVRIAGRPVAGVLSVKAVGDVVPAGTPVCFAGVKSGISCGPMVRADSQGIKVDVASASGDSGSPVFVVDGRTQTVTLIGLLSGRVDGAMGATYLDSALEAAGTEALVDAAAADTVATGDPNYSLRISPQ